MTAIDPDNLVVQMCAEGMQLEGQARLGDARLTFEKAWRLAESAYERCIAAHYLARHQPNPDATLEWNLRSLALADEVRAGGGGELVAGFYPSLQLNVGHSYEQLGDLTAAAAGYRAAQVAIDELEPVGGVGRGVTPRPCATPYAAGWSESQRSHSSNHTTLPLVVGAHPLRSVLRSMINRPRPFSANGSGVRACGPDRSPSVTATTQPTAVRRTSRARG